MGDVALTHPAGSPSHSRIRASRLRLPLPSVCCPPTAGWFLGKRYPETAKATPRSDAPAPRPYCRRRFSSCRRLFRCGGPGPLSGRSVFVTTVSRREGCLLRSALSPFDGAYAVLAFVASSCRHYGWLTTTDMVRGWPCRDHAGPLLRCAVRGVIVAFRHAATTLERSHHGLLARRGHVRSVFLFSPSGAIRERPAPRRRPRVGGRHRAVSASLPAWLCIFRCNAVEELTRHAWGWFRLDVPVLSTQIGVRSNRCVGFAS